MRRWLLVMSLCAWLSAAPGTYGYSVSGTLHGITRVTSTAWVYAIPNSFDTFYVSIQIVLPPPLPSDSTYGFNLEEGGYFLFAYQDLNLSLTPDLDEPRGFYGGDFPQILYISRDTASVDITLRPPNSGGFSGRLIYNGNQEGTRLVIAHRTADFSGLPSGIGFVLDTTGTGRYLAFVDSFGVYYAFGFVDVNRNLTPDPDEPYGVYGGSTPAPINIQPTNFPDDINITINDPDLAARPLRVLPQQISVGDLYPNPFNGSGVLPFSLPNSMLLEISLYDLLGRKVAVLAGGEFAAGEHRLLLSSDERATGSYIVQFRGPGYSLSKRILLLK